MTDIKDLLAQAYMRGWQDALQVVRTKAFDLRDTYPGGLDEAVDTLAASMDPTPAPAGITHQQPPQAPYDNDAGLDGIDRSDPTRADAATSTDHRARAGERASTDISVRAVGKVSADTPTRAAFHASTDTEARAVRPRRPARAGRA